MDFSGPQFRDMTEVRSLNQAYLDYLRSDVAGRYQRRLLPPSLRELLRGLTDLQVRRLAAAPFLLLCLREYDDLFWASMLADDRNGDLFAIRPDRGDPGYRIVTAATGFAWQLARRNPYVARIVCGASPAWCEQLTSCTLVSLLHRVADRDDILEPRFAANEDFWCRLLRAGLSSVRDIRAAAHLCALQTVLTAGETASDGRQQAAACRTPAQALQLADKDSAA